MVRTDSRAKTLDTYVQRRSIISSPREVSNLAESSSSSSSHPEPMDIVQEPYVTIYRISNEDHPLTSHIDQLKRASQRDQGLL